MYEHLELICGGNLNGKEDVECFSEFFAKPTQKNYQHQQPQQPPALPVVTAVDSLASSLPLTVAKRKREADFLFELNSSRKVPKIE